MASVTLINLITATDMTSGWSLAGTATPPGYGGGYSIKLVGPTTAKEKVVSTKETIALDNTHIYYARWYGYQTATASTDSTGCYWPLAEPYMVEAIPCKDAGLFQMYSVVNHRQSFANDNYPFRLDYNNDFIAGTMYVSAPMLIDLTDCFGAGKEPTCEWLDMYIPYFSGSREFNSDLWNLKDITPVMTSNTTPSGYIASASSEVTVPRAAWCAFDSISSTDEETHRWHSGSTDDDPNPWVQLQFPEAHTVTAFWIKNAVPRHTGIISFQLLGSNDGSSYVTLGSYTNATAIGETTIFEVTNPGSYKYYKVYVLSSSYKTKETATINYSIIDQIRFFERASSVLVKNDGVWLEASEMFVKQSGEWHSVSSALARTEGEWYNVK